MQLLATEDFYFIKSIRTILRCCRTTALLSITNHAELAVLGDVRVYGDVHCCVGKITIDSIHYLLLVTECTNVAHLEHSDSIVYRIDKICALPLIRDGFIHSGLFACSKFVSDSLTKLKNHHKKIVKFVSEKVSPTSRFIDDIVRFINESSNFYFSFSTDLTLSTQKKSNQTCGNGISDEKYFWNKKLLRDFYDENDLPVLHFSEWIVPVIYGYVSQKSMYFEAETKASFTLISRRSVKRAGVRYLRRGIDPNGDVANFVETEFIIHVFGHCLSSVQIRGSVPIFWSQKGYRFRPPLSIDRTFDESFPAFQKHITSLITNYSPPIVIVNLVEQNGRELCLGENFLQHIIELNSPDITFVSFDFHQNCRALRFDKVHDLVNLIENEISSIGFCWLDKKGVMVREQKGIIRTNCVDCLDRTNVVQCALSQAICLTQARKLGLIEPDEFENTKLEYMETMIHLIQGMWADHGDSISKQYAGTNALKGDVTRGGQRKLIGFMKDGYNSASRYYLSQFHDAQRQRIIDALLSGTVSTTANSNIGRLASSDNNIRGTFANDNVTVSTIVDFEGQNNASAACWYDDEFNLTEEDDDDDFEATEYEDFGLSPMNLSSKLADNKSDTNKNTFLNKSFEKVRFDAESDSVVGGWVMVDALKRRIAESKSRILIL